MPNGQHIPDDAPGWAGFLIGQVGALSEGAKEIKTSVDRLHQRMDNANDVDRDFAERLTAVESDVENCPAKSGAQMPPAPPADAPPARQKLGQVVTRMDLVKFVVAMVGMGGFVTGVLIALLRLLTGLEIDIPGV